MSIATQLNQIKESLPSECTLIAVSKTKTVEMIMEAYDAGHRDFGENKVQELTKKADEMPKDIRWHMIGHLQRNKVKYIASFVYLIHGVDSFKLLEEINKQANKTGRMINCLLQIHIAEEESKFGFDESELKEMLSSEAFRALSNIQIVGLMGMATFTEREDQIRKEFNYLKSLFDTLKDTDHAHLSMEILSMGMSGDYEIALEAGSNMVRIGSAIFGERNF